jgi:integrase
MMPNLKNKPPSYCFHKASGQAVVWLDGRTHYLGTYGSPESHAAYRRLIAERAVALPFASASQQIPVDVRSDLRLNELLLAYMEFAREYYVKNGKPTGEHRNMEDAIRPLRDLYEGTRVWDFGPAALRAVRDRMVAANLSRKVVNARINRIRRIFKWGVERELVDPSVLQGLQSVAPLKEGRSKARESERVKPVDQKYIDAVLTVVTRQVQAMIRLQLVTGMRPGEVILMRGIDIDMSGKIWEYRPASHKTQHHGIDRVVFLGPRAQELLRDWLRADVQAYLFSPREAIREMNQLRAKNAKGTRDQSKAKRRCKPRKKPGDHYTPTSYCYAIHKACKRLDIPVWGPNRLRHNAATFLRQEFGIEAARVILGHSSAAITEIYAEMDRKKAAEIMGIVG